jgi:hypothetical protein
MNYKEGGHTRMEGGNPSGIIIPLFIKGCCIIPSKVSLLEGSRTSNFEIKDLA